MATDREPLDEDMDGEGFSASPWNTIAYAALRYRRLVLLVTVVGAVWGLLSGVLQPNTYESSGKLLVRSGAREAATPESRVAGKQRGPATSSRQAVADELHILSDPSLLEKVAREVRPSKILQPYDPAARDGPQTPALTRLVHAFQSWWLGGLKKEGNDEDGESGLPEAVQALQGGLSYGTDFNSSVIEVRYVALSEKLAHDVIDAFLRVALDHHQEVFRLAPGFSNFINEQENQALSEARQGVEELAQFQSKHDIVDLDVQRAGLFSNIDAAEQKILGVKLELAELKQRLALMTEGLKSLNGGSHSADIGLPHPEYSRLLAKRSALDLRLLDLQRRPRETPDEFQRRKADLEARIERTDKELEKQPPYLPRDDERRVELLIRRDQARESIAALESSLKQREAWLKGMRERLAKLATLESEYRRLQKRVEGSRQQAEQFSDSRRSVEMMDMLNQAEMSNLKILQQATMPLEKVGPRRFRTLVVSCFLAFLGGMALAIGLGMTSSTVRRARDLRNVVQGEVLAVVPEIGSRSAKRGGDGASFVGLEETIDTLWSKLALDSGLAPESKIAFVASRPGDGCTTVAASASIGLAQQLREPVILVEANFERPQLLECFGLGTQAGLAEVLCGEASIRDAMVQTDVPGLTIIGGGAGAIPEPGVFATEHGSEVLASLAKECRFLCLDLAPLQRHPESRLLLWNADAAVAVVRAGFTRKLEAAELIQAVRDAKTRFLGTVLSRYRPIRPFFFAEPRWVSAPASGVTGSESCG